MTKKQKPIDTVRLPGGLKATTWLNVSKDGTKTYTTTSITRTIKTKEGYRDTSVYSLDELLKVAKVALSAYDRNVALLAERKEAASGAQEQVEDQVEDTDETSFE